MFGAGRTGISHLLRCTVISTQEKQIPSLLSSAFEKKKTSGRAYERPAEGENLPVQIGELFRSSKVGSLESSLQLTSEELEAHQQSSHELRLLSREMPAARTGTVSRVGKERLGGLASTYQAPRHTMFMPAQSGMPQKRSFMTLTDPAAITAYTSRLQDVSQELPVVRSLVNAVEDHQFAVVYGGPSTGKTEQIEIAFGRNQKTFDLRQEFYNHTIVAEKRPNTNENWRALTTDKEKQLKWLKENYEEIKNKLKNDPAKTTILDEIDLTNSDQMSAPEVEAAQLMIQMAEELKKEGKNVIVILHEVGVNNDVIGDEMLHRGLLKDPSQVIETGFFPLETAEKFTEIIGLNAFETDSISGYTQGSPLAFNRLLADAARASTGEPVEKIQTPEYNDMLREATLRAERIWNIQKNIAAPKTLELLTQIVHREKDINDPEVLEHREELLATSLVGATQEGKLIVPELTYDIIEREAENRELEKFGELMVLKNADEVKSMCKDHPEYEKAANYSLEICGSVRFLKRGEDFFVIPGYSISTSHSWDTQRQVINTALKKVNQLVPYESETTEHLDFANSAETVEELHNDAHLAKPHFSTHLEAVAARTGAEVNAGLDNQFMVKSRSSLQAKVKRWTEENGASEKAVLQKINDPLRATLICKDLTTLENTIREFFHASEESEIVVGQAYSNKFDAKYPSGYVGYHCNGIIKIDGKEVRFEVQFHVQSIVDGTDTSLKELSHRLYESTRGDPGEEKICIDVNSSGKLLFGAGMSPISSELPRESRVIEQE